MLSYLLLGLSIVMGAGKSALYNQHAKTCHPDGGGVLRFNAVSFAVGCVAIALTGGTFLCSWVTVACAAAYAVIVFSLQSLTVLTMKRGPMALTSLMVLYGMILPALAGPIFWDEKFGVSQIIGLVLMLVSFFLLEYAGEETEKKRGFWPMALGCFLLSGGAGLMEKIHQSTPYKDERNGFLMVGYGLMLVLALGGSLLTRTTVTSTQARRSRWVWGALTGVIMGVYCRVNLTLAGTLDSLLYYPVANGGTLLLTVLISVLLFKEKATGRQWVGFGLGLCSIVALSLPI